MKRIIKSNLKLWDEAKFATGCGVKGKSSGHACKDAEILYKIKGGKYKENFAKFSRKSPLKINYNTGNWVNYSKFSKRIKTSKNLKI
jgi:hypothetical protein